MCEKTWPSANTWIEWKPEFNTWQKYWQSCRKCPKDETNKVYPARIRPLLHSGNDHNRKQHLTEHCQKCKQLGSNCRNYVPCPEPDDDDDDGEDEDFDDDDVSVISESDASSISGLRDDDLDGRSRTPVPSDVEATEEFLSSKLGNLGISGKK